MTHADSHGMHAVAVSAGGRSSQGPIWRIITQAGSARNLIGVKLAAASFAAAERAIRAHGFVVALPVLLSTTSGVQATEGPMMRLISRLVWEFLQMC